MKTLKDAVVCKVKYKGEYVDTKIMYMYELDDEKNLKMTIIPVLKQDVSKITIARGKKKTRINTGNIGKVIAGKRIFIPEENPTEALNVFRKYFNNKIFNYKNKIVEYGALVEHLEDQIKDTSNIDTE